MVGVGDWAPTGDVTIRPTLLSPLAIGGGFVFSASYIGRAARDLLAQRDPMTPNNLKDPKSGMDWFTAATQLEQLRRFAAERDLVHSGMIQGGAEIAAAWSAVSSKPKPSANARIASSRLRAMSASAASTSAPRASRSITPSSRAR